MICPKCKCDVITNGIGPAGSPKFNFVLRNIFRISCKLFHEAGNLHDYRYHIYKFGKVRADRLFLRDMLLAIKNRKCNWFTKRWFTFTANKFYLAVKIGGGGAYDAAQLECIKNQAKCPTKNVNRI